LIQKAQTSNNLRRKPFEEDAKMSQKLQLIARVMLLLFLPAFVLRPVVVTVENSLQNSASIPAQKACGSYQTLTADHVNLRFVSRETSQIPTLSPCFQKTILASSKSRVLAFVPTAVNASPQQTLVLRI
jgi:hypothetical protein